MRFHPRIHSARSTDEFVFHQLVPYLGNKRNLLDLIGTAIDACGIDPAQSTFLDAFAGSGVVARYAKQRGFAVIANDWEPYARVLNTAAIACNAPPACEALGGYAAAIAHLNALPGIDGWVTTNLCPIDDGAPDPLRERMFYRRATGRRFDAIRAQIAAWILRACASQYCARAARFSLDAILASRSQATQHITLEKVCTFAVPRSSHRPASGCS